MAGQRREGVSSQPSIIWMGHSQVGKKRGKGNEELARGSLAGIRGTHPLHN